MSITPTSKFRFFVTLLLLLVLAFTTPQAQCGCGLSKMDAKHHGTAVNGNNNTVIHVTVIHNHFHTAHLSPRELTATERHIHRMRAGRRLATHAITNSSPVVALATAEWSDLAKKPKPRTPLTVTEYNSSDLDDVETFDLTLPGTPA